MGRLSEIKLLVKIFKADHHLLPWPIDQHHQMSRFLYFTGLSCFPCVLGEILQTKTKNSWCRHKLRIRSATTGMEKKSQHSWAPSMPSPPPIIGSALHCSCQPLSHSKTFLASTQSVSFNTKLSEWKGFFLLPTGS